MTDDQRGTRAGAAPSGDPVQDMLLGLASTIDQLAALLGGPGGEAFGGGVAGSPIPGMVGELGALVTELGDVLARLLSALIAILEAIADTLRSAPATAPPPPQRFEAIPVHVTVAGR